MEGDGGGKAGGEWEGVGEHRGDGVEHEADGLIDAEFAIGEGFDGDGEGDGGDDDGDGEEQESPELKRDGFPEGWEHGERIGEGIGDG